MCLTLAPVLLRDVGIRWIVSGRIPRGVWINLQLRESVQEILSDGMTRIVDFAMHLRNRFRPIG
jgi:hypothetical protein